MFGIGLFAWMFEKPLAAGTGAPEFTLPDEGGRTVSLAQFRGTNVVLIFYPGDETPVCRRQLCEFRDRWDLVQLKDTVILGINPQGAASHAAFRERRKLPFPLLVDEGQRVAQKYNAGGWLVRRTVYLVGRDGRIRYSRRGKPKVEEVLAAAE